MEVLSVVQGSQDWLAVRAQHFCASDAPVAMGVSKFKSRSDLLREKATGHTPEVDAAKQRLFDAGHAAEDAARPLVEEVIGEELYPCVGTAIVDGLALLASFDGLTMTNEIMWESKLYNDNLARDVERSELEPHYWAQLEHSLLVSGADKAYFTCTDGTPERSVGMWYESRPERRAKLIAAWKQFRDDLANYQHVEVLPAAVAAVQPSLPAVMVQTSGAISVTSNLPKFATALQEYIKTIPAKPSTDQEFADAEAACAALKKAEVALQAAEDGALATMSDVEEMRRVVADLRKLSRDTRLATEKLVAARKDSIRFEIRDEAAATFAKHIATLNEAIGRPYMPAIATDFAGVMKNKRTVQSLRDAVADEMSRAKIAANEVSERIQINMRFLRENAADHAALFPDTATIVLKAPDDLQSLVTARISEHKAAEAKREAEIVRKANIEARIRQIKSFEALALAKTTSADVLPLIEQVLALPMDGMDEFASNAQTARDFVVTRMQMLVKSLAHKEAQSAAPVAPAAETPAPATAGTVSSGYAPVTTAMRAGPAVHISPAAAKPAAPSTPPSLSLGAIGDRLGFGVTAAFLATLGFEPAARVKNSVLFHDSDFGAICRALIEHIETVAELAPA